MGTWALKVLVALEWIPPGATSSSTTPGLVDTTYVVVHGGTNLELEIYTTTSTYLGR